jgi:hypothetical protein
MAQQTRTRTMHRQLLSDADSALAWADSDGPSAFSSTGVIQLNLALESSGQALAVVTTRSLAARRGRVRLLCSHRTPANERCPPSSKLPLEAFRCIAESLPRLHGIGPLCNECGDEEQFDLLFRIAAELNRPLAELRVRDEHRSANFLFEVVERAVRTVSSPALAPYLRALSLPLSFQVDRHPRVDETYAALARLPQLTQLECESQMWVQLVALQPRAAMYGPLRSLTLLCRYTPLSSLRASLCNSGLVQLHRLQLLGSLDMLSRSREVRDWSAFLSALPRLDTLVLFLSWGAMVDDALTHLVPDAAVAIVQPPLRMVRLKIFADPQWNPRRGVVEQALARCPQLCIELHFASLRELHEMYNAVLPVPNSSGLDTFRGFLERWRVEWEWSGLPRTTWAMD